jgi:hypothetical protein
MKTVPTDKSVEDFLHSVEDKKRRQVLYLMTGFERYEELMSHLGKHKTGKSCLYVNKLEQVDEAVLRELIAESMRYMNEKYG